MSYADSIDYKNGLAAGAHVARNYGVRIDDARYAAKNVLGYSPAYQAGYTDALLDYVQTREELAPGCYRVKPLRGAE